MRRFGYDYWALGHVHAAEEICQDPWIVYPGNIQGRNVRETGPKGAMRVVVEDGRVVSVSRVPLDAARWEHVRVEASDCDDEEEISNGSKHGSVLFMPRPRDVHWPRASRSRA